MTVELKRLERQTIVITGASSGIGLTTAMLAARRGARVVLAARNETALAQAVAAIHAGGGRATYVVADVADPQQVAAIATHAVDAFGGFDTWINNAGIGLYGRAEAVTLEDHHRLFDVNYFGVVHGCLAALPHLKAHGGAIINVGSVASDRTLPLLGLYAATKHAVKAFTDSLRMDLEREGAPVSVTLVKPGSIDTPFYENARNYLANEAQPLQPVYAPDVAAEAILACAERPTCDLFVGGGAKMMSAMGQWTPALADRAMQPMYDAQLSDRPLRDAAGNLHEPRTGSRRGKFTGTVRERSTWTTAALNPLATVAVALGVGAAVLAAARLLRSAPDPTADDRADHRLDDTLVHGALAGTVPTREDVAVGLFAARGLADVDATPSAAPVPDRAESAQYTPGWGGDAATRTLRTDAGAHADAGGERLTRE